MYLSTHPPCGFGWIDGHVTSRNQVLFGLFQWLREAEKRDPGNEVGYSPPECRKPKLMQLQSQSQAKKLTIVFSQSWIVIYSLSQTKEEQKKNQLGQWLWKRDGVTQTKTNATLGFTSQLDLLVNQRQYLGCVRNYSPFFRANEKTNWNRRNQSNDSFENRSRDSYFSELWRLQIFLLELPYFSRKWGFKIFDMKFTLQARRRGGRLEGFERTPLEVSNGGLKAQTVEIISLNSRNHIKGAGMVFPRNNKAQSLASKKQ